MTGVFKWFWKVISKTYEPPAPHHYDDPPLGDGRPIRDILAEHDVRIRQTDARLAHHIDQHGGDAAMARLLSLQERKFDPTDEKPPEGDTPKD
jgi:hypothetical protein